MKQVITIKLAKTWSDAWLRYGWERGTEGFCVDYSLLTIAQMADKDILFTVKRRKRAYMIDPDYAKYVIKENASVFTRKKDKKPVAVIPSNKCTIIE